MNDITKLFNISYSDKPDFHLQFYIDYSLMNSDLAAHFELHEEQFENIFYYTFHAIQEHLIEQFDFKKLITRKDNLIDIQYFFNDKESYEHTIKAYQIINEKFEKFLQGRNHLLTYGGHELDFKISMSDIVQYTIDQLHNGEIPKTTTPIQLEYFEDLPEEDIHELKKMKFQQHIRKNIL